MKIILLILMLFCSNIYGQNKIHPSYRSKSEFDKLAELAQKTDSIIMTSDKMEYKKKLITSGISEGSIQLTDSLKVEIGYGGFSTYTYTNNKTNKIIKAEYNRTIHYNYDNENFQNGNTERLEINIYYENEKAYYAEFNENHYDNENVISTNRFYLQLNTKLNGIYYSNEFQRKIVEYLTTLSEDIISQKLENKK